MADQKASCALALAVAMTAYGCADSRPPAQATHEVHRGGIRATFRGNGIALSGLASLRRHNAEAFSAGGLNFEHVMAGHASLWNAMTPRAGPFTLLPRPGGATLHRRASESPWGVGARATFNVTPTGVDFEFVWTIKDPARFAPHGHATFFVANYLAGPDSPEPFLWGLAGPGATPGWVRTHGPGPVDSYLPLGDPGLTYVATDWSLALNSSHLDWPRTTRPLLWGCQGPMVLILMLDRPVRFTVAKWGPATAWDFALVARDLSVAQHRVCGRVVWKRFVDSSDVLDEYQSWRSSK